VYKRQRENGVFLMQFKKREDYERVRDLGDTWMRGCFTLIRHWSEGKALRRKEITTLPIWVTFPNFPLHLWHKVVFDRLASVLGKPIRMDRHTGRGPSKHVPRILVEMEAKGEFPDHVAVYTDMDDEIEEQIQVRYERPPPLCPQCGVFGHWPGHHAKKDQKDQSSEGEAMNNRTTPQEGEGSSEAHNEQRTPTTGPISSRQHQTVDRHENRGEQQGEEEGRMRKRGSRERRGSQWKD